MMNSVMADSVVASASEVEAALSAAREVCGPVLHSAPAGDGWIEAARLGRDPQRVRELIGNIIEALDARRMDVAGQQLIESWAWSLAAPAVACSLRSALLPALGAENVRLRPAGGAMGVALERPRGHRVESATAPGELASVLEEHLRPAVVTVNEVARRPEKALWRGVGDRLAGAALWVGEQLGRPDDGEVFARRALAADTAFRGRLRVDCVDIPGASPERMQVRTGCCIWYRSAATAKCLTCPLLSKPERDELTRAWVRERDGA